VNHVLGYRRAGFRQPRLGEKVPDESLFCQAERGFSERRIKEPKRPRLWFASDLMLYLAASLIVFGVAIFVAAPLLLDSGQRSAAARSDELARLEHDRALAIAALRELEFDREMSKLSESDSTQLRAQLENRALTAMAAIEELTAVAKPKARMRSATSQPRPPKVYQSVPEQTVTMPRFRFCPDCGARSPSTPTANFCPGCGRALAAMERAS
jgi:hypothetical protein